jgi:hypothetical protein
MAKQSVKIQEIREVFESLEDKRFEPYVEHLLSDIVMNGTK